MFVTKSSFIYSIVRVELLNFLLCARDHARDQANSTKLAKHLWYDDKVLPNPKRIGQFLKADGVLENFLKEVVFNLEKNWIEMKIGNLEENINLASHFMVHV